MSTKPASAPRAQAVPGRDNAGGDRRLRLDDILKLMVADGLVAPADAEHLARSRTQRFEHPLELIAEQNWKSLAPPHRLLALESLVEWLAGKLGVPLPAHRSAEDRPGRGHADDVERVRRALPHPAGRRRRATR